MLDPNRSESTLVSSRKPSLRCHPWPERNAGTSHQGRSAESSSFRKEFPYEKTDVDLLRACARDVLARGGAGSYQAGRDEAGHHESRKGIGKGGQPVR